MMLLNYINRKSVYFAAIFILLLHVSCTESAEAGKSIMDKTKDAATKTTDAVKSAANEVNNISKDAVEAVAESATDAKESMVEGAEAGMDKAKEIATKSGDAIEKVTSKTKEIATKSGEDIAEGAQEVAKKVKEVLPNITKDTPSSSKPTKQNTPTTKASTPVRTTTTKPSTESVSKSVKEEKESKVPSKPAPDGVNHETFDHLLRKHVSASGDVNYAGFKADINKFNTYLEQLKQNPVRSNWPRDKQLAYWINAYNAFTIKLILDNYPVGSITDLEGGKPWDKKWITLGDKTYSLNNIENDIIRPQFKEPRIHFAVNCAAVSCPPLLNKAWTAVNLEKYFEAQTKAFINNTKFNQISSSKATVSKIFEWYGEDFGDLRSFLNKYANASLKSKSNIEYKEYNWRLNGN